MWWRKSIVAAVALLVVALAASTTLVHRMLVGQGSAAAWALAVSIVGVWVGSRAMACAIAHRRLPSVVRSRRLNGGQPRPARVLLGPDLAAGLRERWPGLRVILMTGYEPDEALRREAEAGGFRFVQKPFNIAALAAEARAALTEGT